MQTLTNFILKCIKSLRLLRFSRNYWKSQYEFISWNMKKNHAGRARVLCASGFDRAFVSWFVMRRLQQMGVSFTIFITTPILWSDHPIWLAWWVSRMLCSCWLHCLCPGTGTCPASWGLRGKDLVFFAAHGHMGVTVTRQQELESFAA